MKRRTFLAALGVVATPAVVRKADAQPVSKPVVGFLNPTLPHTNAERVREFLRGLKDAGYVEPNNVLIEYRWAEGQFHRMPELAVELVRQRVAVIATTGGPVSALAAKAATQTIPIVFAVAVDPVALGLVKSLARPEANLTGVSIFNTELTAKRLHLLRELVPAARRVAVLVNPVSSVNTDATVKDLAIAAGSLGIEFQVVPTATSAELDAAFQAFARERPDALFVGNDGFS